MGHQGVIRVVDLLTSGGHQWDVPLDAQTKERHHLDKSPAVVFIEQETDEKSDCLEKLVREKDIENLVALYPDEFFPKEKLKLISQQYVVKGKRFDILFEDKHCRKVIVEIKLGILSRDASGQIVEHYGLLKNKFSKSGTIGNRSYEDPVLHRIKS